MCPFCVRAAGACATLSTHSTQRRRRRNDTKGSVRPRTTSLSNNRLVGKIDDVSEGRIWIAEDFDPEDEMLLSGRFSGYLERGDHSQEEAFENLPADEAIAWGRARAAVVLIRTGDGDYHSAG